MMIILTRHEGQCTVKPRQTYQEIIGNYHTLNRGPSYSRFGNACFDRESDQIKNQKARKIRKIEEFRSAPLADLRLSKTA